MHPKNHQTRHHRKISLALLGIAHRQITAERLAEDPPKLNRKRLGTAPKTLGEWLRFWRQTAGLTQRQVAERASVPRRRIQMSETDDVVLNPEEITAIERAIGIDVAIEGAWAQQ